MFYIYIIYIYNIYIYYIYIIYIYIYIWRERGMDGMREGDCEMDGMRD